MTGLATLAATAAGCRRQDDRPDGPHVTLRLADIPDGGRLEVQVDDQPIELLRTGRTLEARLLLCTHMGCPIAWVADEGSYRCPCHGGRFDAEGRVVAGSPTRALDRAPVFLDADVVTVYKAKVVKPSTGAFHQGAACDGAGRRLG
jgi:Rieske Fe-S protein